jgi:hypothetical protein
LGRPGLAGLRMLAGRPPRASRAAARPGSAAGTRVAALARGIARAGVAALASGSTRAGVAGLARGAARAGGTDLVIGWRPGWPRRGAPATAEQPATASPGFLAPGVCRVPFLSGVSRIWTYLSGLASAGRPVVIII